MTPWLSVYPPLSPSVYLRRPAPLTAFPLSDENCRLFSRARQGLWHGLSRLGLGAGDEILAPAFHHGSEIATLIAAGCSPRFYGLDERLEPDAAELERLVNPQVRALYLIHYLGMPQDGKRWRRWCDERGLSLIEDAAQSWLSSREGEPTGSHGDLSIFCLYKMVSLPDGGAVVAKSPLEAATGTRRRGFRAVARLHRHWLAQQGAIFSPLRREATRAHKTMERPDRDFGLGDPEDPAAQSTTFLARRSRCDQVVARRRTNYLHLQGRIAPDVVPPFARLSPGACPLAFPIMADDKPALLDRLADKGIIHGKMWEVPHPALPVGRFPQAASLRRELVGLPVHQELTRGDLDRIVDAVSDATSRS